MNSPKASLFKPHWAMLGVTALLLVLVATLVDLKPQVGQNFFFSSNDPQFKESAKIDKIFPSASQLIVSVTSSDITSTRYLNRLGQLTTQLESIEGVSSAESLTDGPKNVEDARKSPFWKRLLISENGKTSNVIVFASSKNGERLITRMEAIIDKLSAKDFQIQMAGAPYVAEMIRRNLRHDFSAFTLTSVLLFGAAMWGLFRSYKLTLGIVATCSSAVLTTLLVQSIFGEKIGILTANLTTIVFVVTLSHLVYMTFNWQTIADEGGADSHDLGSKAWRMTLPASFWSMVCASLGFGSLLIVPAKPLRELGVGGVLGTVVAMICAYLMYPAFLNWAAPKETRQLGKEFGMQSGFWERTFVPISVATVAVSLLLCFGLLHLNTDPSLLDYFKKGEQPRLGLEYIDKNGGSNPLTMVLAPSNGKSLANKDEYQRMWELQNALENHKGVGTVISLPVLMAEGKRHFFSFLFSWNQLLNIMNSKKFERVASNFVTKDRTMAAFYFRMVEGERDKHRAEVVDDLKALARKHGFRPVLTGGVYQLQGALAKLVQSSLVEGLFWLMVFFTGVAWVVGRKLRTVAAMIFSLSLVPVCMLGGLGLLHTPVDIISAPATNVCIGMAIDSMVHLIFAVRRAQKNGENGWASWVAGRKEQWRGIVYSDVIIAAGFAIFALSNFPPTQRFGMVVVTGTIIDILANIFLLPFLGGADWKHLKAQPKSAKA